MNRHIRHTILLALAIVVMAACGGGGSDVPSPAPTPTPTPTPTNPTDPEPTPIPEPEQQQVPIGFRADLSDAVATTRSVGDGVLTTPLLETKGFGVYCWYTGTAPFTTPSASINMLMRNQKVIYNETSSKWTYSPSKYWPLDPDEMLTFRAYAPYTDYLKEDDYGMPQLPVVVTKDDYHNGTQHDPLFGTGKLLQTTGENVGEYVSESVVFGLHYDNIKYPMSGTYRLNKTTDPTEGTIHWYFHHGMAKLMFYAKLEENAGETAVIVSITIGPFYDQGLLSISSPAASITDEPLWGDPDPAKRGRAGNMDVTLYGKDDTHTQDLAEYNINNDDLTLLTSQGLLVIPRRYDSTPLTITVRYKSNDQISTVTTKLPNEKSNFNEFKGNKIYTLNLTVGNALVADIESVNVATTIWNEEEKDHEVYNW